MKVSESSIGPLHKAVRCHISLLNMSLPEIIIFGHIKYHYPSISALGQNVWEQFSGTHLSGLQDKTYSESHWWQITVTSVAMGNLSLQVVYFFSKSVGSVVLTRVPDDWCNPVCYWNITLNLTHWKNSFGHGICIPGFLPQNKLKWPWIKK